MIWGISGAALGSWEALALTTGRIPTISNLVWGRRGNQRRLMQALVLFWLLGVGKHLLFDQSPSFTTTVHP